MSRLDGKIVIVTGASSGIGRATALRLGSEGATVACLDVVEDANEKTAAQIREGGGVASARRCDVSDAASVASAVEGVIAEHGDLHVVCNIAGIGRFAHSHELAVEEWDRTIGVNLTGTFLMAQAALRHFVPKGEGAIINTASTAGLMGQPYSAAYCASKGGVVQLTKALAAEYLAHRGIRITAVAPGGIVTPLVDEFAKFPEGADGRLLHKMMLPDAYMASPDEVAGLFAYLASDEARYINGAVYAIDGGLTA